MVTAGIEIEALNAQHAIKLFNEMDDKALLDELSENSIEITEVFETE